jgi:hypothetical protein
MPSHVSSGSPVIRAQLRYHEAKGRKSASETISPVQGDAQLHCEFPEVMRNKGMQVNFQLGLSGKDAAYRGTTDAEGSEDFRLAEAGAV